MACFMATAATLSPRGGRARRGFALAVSLQAFVSRGWRERVVGLDRPLSLLDGRLAPYVSLDNAATTPPLRDVLAAVESFLPCYGSVHRGSGFNARFSTAAYDEAHRTVARFVGADPDRAVVILGK